jgi:hypothetical protein
VIVIAISINIKGLIEKGNFHKNALEIYNTMKLTQSFISFYLFKFRF